MKKYIKIFCLILMILLPIKIANAAGSVTVSPGSISLAPGQTRTITVTANNAAGRVDISSNNTGVATVSKSSEWVENGSITFTVTGVGEGSASINVKLTDVATFDGEVLSGTKTVSTTVKIIKVTENTTDATLSSLAISGYTIDFKKDITSYQLDVNNDVSKLNIVATPTISTAKVDIVGADNLKLGKNQVKIVVTSKGGNIKEYLIEVNRKDNIPETTIENVKETLANTTKDTVAINLGDNKKLSNEVINNIKSSKKNIILNKYDANNNLSYSWIIDNKNIESLKDFDLTISFKPENKNEIEESSNYSEMININFKDENKLPKNSKVKVYVGNKYANNTVLNSYSYNKEEKTFKLLSNELKVKDGYIELEIKNKSDYILTRSNLNITSGINGFFIASTIEAVALISLAAYTFIPRIKTKIK